MSTIIQTSSGPAILTSEGRVVMPGDVELFKVLDTEPQVVADLVVALNENVQACDLIIAKVAALEVLSQEENDDLNRGMKCLGSIFNVSTVVNSRPFQAQERHSHE